MVPKKYFRISLLLSAALSFTIHFSLLANFFFENRNGSHDFSIGFIIFELFTTFLIGIILYLLNYSFFKPFDIHSKLTLKKIVTSVVLTFLVAVIIIFILSRIGNPFNIEFHSHRHKEIIFSRNLFGATVVLISIFIIRLVFQKQSIQLENEKLKSESLQSQFESLKNQMSPHFLFNSLTALKSLIEDSPKLAEQYINHLSQVLRYTLQSHKKQIVTLKEELDFTESYLFLLKMRYDTNFRIETDIQKKYYNHGLPPLTIQTLVENAVKHNEISQEFPLLISIQTNDPGFLTVKNKIQEKLTPENGTGIGLTNLIKLFQILGEKKIQIINNGTEFIVEVPLIEP
jgi:sensor histidine kinase YesM